MYGFSFGVISCYTRSELHFGTGFNPRLSVFWDGLWHFGFWIDQSPVASVFRFFFYFYLQTGGASLAILCHLHWLLRPGSLCNFELENYLETAFESWMAFCAVPSHKSARRLCSKFFQILGFWDSEILVCLQPVQRTVRIECVKWCFSFFLQNLRTKSKDGEQSQSMLINNSLNSQEEIQDQV